MITENFDNYLKDNRKSNFYYSFLFLPSQKRKDINLFYSFCNISDDIVDSKDDIKNKTELFNIWSDEFSKGLKGSSKFKIQNDIGKLITRLNINISYFTEFLRGMEMDLHNQRYQTFEDLYQYCYRVASTVGLISKTIFDCQSKTSNDYAINLGIALQMTNIIRDIKQDILMDRIYIPLNELTDHNISEADLFNFKYNDKFIELMKILGKRAHEYFQKAENYLDPIDKNNFLAARIMKNIYYEILKKIESNNFNVFNESYKLSKFNKISIALKTFFE